MSLAGYNIALKLSTKTVCGVTQDDLSISALTKDSITKDDAGVIQSAVTGHEITFKVTGLITVSSTASPTPLLRDDLIEQALKTGDNAKIAFVYSCVGGDNYQGNAIMTNYSESSPASPDEDATYTIDLKVVGDMTIVS